MGKLRFTVCKWLDTLRIFLSPKLMILSPHHEEFFKFFCLQWRYLAKRKNRHREGRKEKKSPLWWHRLPTFFYDPLSFTTETKHHNVSNVLASFWGWCQGHKELSTSSSLAHSQTPLLLHLEKCKAQLLCDRGTDSKCEWMSSAVDPALPH